MKQDIDANYVPLKPTQVLTATRGNTTVVAKLYGGLTEARLVREQQIVAHRADQLNPVPKRPERIERVTPAMERYLDSLD